MRKDSQQPPSASVSRVLWRSYIRHALVPVLLIELALVVAYLATNSLVRDRNVAALQRSAEASLLETARIEADVVGAHLQGVADLTAVFAAQVRAAHQRPYQPDAAEQARYLLSDSGVWHTRAGSPGAAMFYSAITELGPAQRQQAWQLAQLDPLLQALVDSSDLVTQAYFNSHDSMNRIYPAIDVLAQYPADLDVRDYSFYYRADAEHNPQRAVVWTDVYVDPAGQGWMTSAIAPVYLDGQAQLQGVVGLDVQMARLIRHVLALKLPWGSYAVLLDGRGSIMAMPTAAEAEWQLHGLLETDASGALGADRVRPDAFNVYRRADSQALAQQLEQADGGVVALTLDGRPKLAAWSRIAGVGWPLLVVADQARLYADADALRARVNRIAIGIILALLLFYLLFLWYLYRQSVRVGQRLAEPMRGLRRMMAAIAQGRFRPPPVQSDIAELAAVSRGLADMGEALRSSRHQLDQANQQLAQSNQALEQRVAARTRALEEANQALRRERSEQTRLIQALRQTQSQLVQSEKMASVGVLAAGVAHEINNPLAFVSANLAMLNDYVPQLLQLQQQTAALVAVDRQDCRDRLEREARLALIRQDLPALLTDALDGVERIRRVTASLLDFSHAGDTQWQRCDLNHCVTSTLVICQHACRHSELRTELDPALPAIRAVPAQLNQVIMALVLNAAQALGRDGRICVGTGHDEQEVWLVVEDNGPGIAVEHRARIFDPFFTTKAAGEGTGLGLAIVQGIVQAHGGRIRVDSTPGAGARFTVTLPREPAAAG